ncbi:MAG: ferredoxin-thioredoxin reductase catalytic domain-containing protein [Pirellulales bacterium]
MKSAPCPPQRVIHQISAYVEKYRRKTGTSAHPDAAVTESVVLGLAQNVAEVGRPLCPCNFYADKQTEVADSRRWVCACDEMKQYKYCHCLLFVTPDGRPITEYLPNGHEGREIYGLVKDPTPDQGRESRHSVGTPMNIQPTGGTK